MSIEISRNAQFDSFVDFAQQSVNAGKSKAVARFGDTVTGSDGLASRTIKPATTDRAFALFRSKSDKTANNQARDLFRQSVINMFGSEDRIPPEVKEAMLLKDYEVGKPLTARRILAVKEAIEKVANPIHKNVSQAVAFEKVTHSLQFIAAKHAERKLPTPTLTPEQMLTAANLVAKYGKGLHEQNLRLISNFTVHAIACGSLNEKAMEAAVGKFARDIAGFRDFLPGDKRMAAIDKKLVAYSQSSLDDYMRSEKASMFNSEGLFESLVKDAPRSSYAINGQMFVFNPDNSKGDAILAAFKAAVKPEHRKAISCFANQMVQSVMVAFMTKLPLPKTHGLEDGMDLTKEKGIEMFVSTDSADRFYAGPIVGFNDQIFKLDVAPNGKSARLVIESHCDVKFMVAGADFSNWNNVIGSFVWKQDMTFDLTKDPPKVASVHIGQSIEA